MRKPPHDIGVIHFIGIGGIGMSGIAEILHNLKYQVQGSDITANTNVCRLQDKGIEVFSGHCAENIENAAIVVYSSAIKDDNPELIAARERKLPVVRRAEMLAELMRLKSSVAVAGTHGKTTTTSLIGWVLEKGGLDPTVINGGIVNAYGANTRMGGGEWMVVEADESDGTFTRLPSTIGIVTNIDMEHADFYKDFSDMRRAFQVFIENLPFYGFAVLCIDHPEVQSLIPQVSDKKIITYGFNPQSDIRAVNIRYRKDKSIFDVVVRLNPRTKETVMITGVVLPMVGRHNVQNALAAIAVACDLGVSHKCIKGAFEGFSGVKRRFTQTGVVGGVRIIDDYGHHPVEIEAVLKAARQSLDGEDGRVITVFQPHRYTRLQALFDEFCTCFNGADHVAIMDVYAAGEDPLPGVSGDALVRGLRAHGHADVEMVKNMDDLLAYVGQVARDGDIVVCLVAGDITNYAHELPGRLKGPKSREGVQNGD